MRVNLKIKREYESILPKLPKEEYEALKESIAKEGLHYPIIVNPNGIILDGHQRYRICKELGIKPKVKIRVFKNPLLEKRFVIETNLLRRHLNDYQKAELAYPLLEIERELARQRQLSKLKHVGKRVSLGSNEHNEQGKARDIVAKKVGLSPITFQRAITIIEKVPEELKEKVRRGKVSIAYAYEMVRRKEKVTVPPLPEGKFNVIYADPPWEYYLPLRGSPDMHYPVMPVEEICKLRVPAAEDAVLFLWATNPKLEEALRVMEAWGFKYVTNLVWVKDKFGTGYYFRGQHELLLVGKRGNLPVPEEQDRPPSVLFAKVGVHSEKPAEVYEMIEKMYPNRKPYLELFARTEKGRPNWVHWGAKTVEQKLL
jgi:N6-adenosine-specific RNA methylase IME4